ncbi:MAG TPA: hypothetical protein PLS03_16895, partial [Terrimicrobiaceae bacterium]|nr:hypothetical protein [Terrimicrobiaceae bacterium]
AWLKVGTAWEKFVAMTEAQGGDASALENLSSIHHAPHCEPFPAARAGTITRLDAGTIGAASVRLGAGRKKASDKVDYAVGFSGIRKCGDRVAAGEPILFVHARSRAAAEQIHRDLEKAVTIS